MSTFLATLLVFGVALLGMAVGVLVAKKPLRGTCGGLGNLADRFGEPMCEICDGDPAQRDPDCVRWTEDDAARARGSMSV